MRTLHHDAVALTRLERIQRADHITQSRLIPTIGAQQVVGFAKSVQAREKGLQILRLKMPQRLAGDGLNHRKGILNAVPALANAQFLGLLRLLSLLLGAEAFEAEAKLTGNGHRKIGLG